VRGIDERERAALERRALELLDSCQEELYEFVAAAVRIPSITGDETQFGQFVFEWLTRHGFETYTRTVSEDLKQEVGGFEGELDLDRRPNVFAWLRGDGASDRQLVLSTHQDVVSPGAPETWSCDPWGGERRDGRIWGRGSTDMKGSIGAALFALRALQESGLRPASDVELQCVVGEENGGLGTLGALASEPPPAGAIVLEPTVLVPLPACSGCVHFTVTVDGRAAHGATPWKGVSALDKLIVVYTALKDLADRRRGEQDHALFAGLPDAAPLSMGVARAGEWRSSVPDKATMIGRFGVMPDESIAHGREQIVSAVREAAAGDDWLREHRPRVSWDNAGFPGWETAPDAPIVQTVIGALEAVTNQRVIGAATYGSDAGHFATAGVPVVLFGPGRIDDAHAPDESVDEDEILTCAKVLALTVARQRLGAADGSDGNR